MDLSIIIATYGRNDILCSTINSVVEECKRSKYSWEIIVVDQTKVHNKFTTDFLENIKKSNLVKIIKKNKPNLPAARNVGIRNSKGKIIMFLDDDIKLVEGFIDAHMSCYKFSNKIMATVGKVTVCNNTKKNILINNKSAFKYLVKKLIFLLYSGYSSKITKRGLVISDFSKEGKFLADTVIGCNMSFKREVFEKNDFFDENFIGNAIREETDLSFRIRKKGYIIKYNSEAHLYHFMYNTGGCRKEKDNDYWEIYFYNQCYFLIKNFNLNKRNIKLNLFIDIIKCKINGINANLIIDNKYNYIVNEMRVKK